MQEIHLPDKFVLAADGTLDALAVQRNFEALLRNAVPREIEPVHVVGTTGQPAYSGTWTSFDAARPATFYKDRGRVYLDGIVKSGTSGSSVFTLPVGWRPVSAFFFPVVADTSIAWCGVYASGQVIPTGTSVGTSTDLSSINFRLA